MTDSSINLKVVYMNIKGQTKLTLDKQLLINDTIRQYDCDIVHLQEID